MLALEWNDSRRDGFEVRLRSQPVAVLNTRSLCLVINIVNKQVEERLPRYGRRGEANDKPYERIFKKVTEYEAATEKI